MTSGRGAAAARETVALAGGKPVSAATADQAAEWLTLLMSGEATDADRQRWQQWRGLDHDNERAWQHIEAVAGRLKILPPGVAYQSLSPLMRPDAGATARRKAMRALLWLGTAGATGVLVPRTQAWQVAVADYRTRTGEQRDVTLADGTRITLNTASAIDVRFDASRRLVRLVEGEVMVVTGHASPPGTAGADPRPFFLETAQGSMRALGTRFAVRQWGAHTSVAVLESAVAIALADAPDEPHLLRAGERVSFTRGRLDAPGAVAAAAPAWTRGQIVADEVRLGDFVAELSRYRPGILRCDPAVAGLRFSGVFLLDDTDRILQMLADTLPVEVRLRTRYWVTIEAEPSAAAGRAAPF